MKAIAAIFDLIPGWMYAIFIAALLGVVVTEEARISSFKSQIMVAKAETAGVKEELAKFREDAQRARADDEADQRKRERELQAAADQMRSRKDAEINRLRADVRDLRYGLQNLPSRPTFSAGGASTTAQAGAPGQVCDGAFIYRETAEDLAGEAERAEIIRIELNRVYDLYERAQQITGRP